MLRLIALDCFIVDLSPSSDYCAASPPIGAAVNPRLQLVLAAVFFSTGGAAIKLTAFTGWQVLDESSHFIEDAGQETMNRVTFYGHEKNETTAKLAQINLAVHGLQIAILIQEDETGADRADVYPDEEVKAQLVEKTFPKNAEEMIAALWREALSRPEAPAAKGEPASPRRSRRRQTRASGSARAPVRVRARGQQRDRDDVLQRGPPHARGA